MFSHLLKFIKNRECLSIGGVFLIMGTLFGNWATLIPVIKTKFQLDDARLGLIILCLPVGAALANPLSTWFIHKYGMQRMTILGFTGMCLFYLLPVLAPAAWLVACALFLTGTSIAFTNVSMNTCASALEHQLKEHIMATCHGLFSLGLMIGSLASSTMIGLSFRPIVQSLLISAVLIFLGIFLKENILSIKDEDHSDPSLKRPRFSLPKGPLLIMILIAMCTNMTEGSMADWSAVYMRDIVHSAAYTLGWGLAAYSFSMALGRFFGDYWIPKYGANNVLTYGGLLSAIGIGLAVIFPSTFLCVLAFSMVGLGVSCGAPILYGAAARLPNLAKGVGLASLNTYSVATFLGGPVIIGFISTAINLRVALALISLIGLLWVFLTSKIKL
ncbi:MAG: MFS transporter [Saprospiraceae bacterium]